MSAVPLISLRGASAGNKMSNIKQAKEAEFLRVAKARTGFTDINVFSTPLRQDIPVKACQRVCPGEKLGPDRSAWQ